MFEDSKEEFRSSGKSTGGFVLPIIFGLIGFFMFGLEGALGAILLYYSYTIISPVAFIPILGTAFWILIVEFLIQPFLFELVPFLAGSSLANLIYWTVFTISLMITIFTSIGSAIKLGE